MRHGKVGMWMGNLSERGGLSWQREWFVNWGMAPLPRDAQSTTQADVEGYAISSQTQHPDACWEWIVFLSQQVTHRLMPARSSLAESAAYEQFAGEGVAAVARVSMEEAVLINPGAFGELGEAMDIFATAVGEAVDENLTAEEAMDWAQREAEGLGPLTSSQ
jgi:ABC-type glycerol-3-phosphate transport system substrate-binding protein